MWSSGRTGVVRLLLLAFAGCGAGSSSLGISDASKHFTPPEALPEAMAARGMSGPELSAAYPSPGRTALGYTPSQAEHMECLQRSRFKLDDEERRILDQQGLVLTGRGQTRTFAMFYLHAFHADLPVFISADAILHAWHRAYDELLVQTERSMLAPMLGQLLSGMRSRLSGAHARPAVRAMLDEYLTVAHSLLQDKPLVPGAGGSAEAVERNFELAQGARGSSIRLFGRARLTDLTQFKPRGHYESHRDLIPYFRAMMWLGRIDFRVLQTNPSGAQVFQRDEFEAMVLLRDVMDKHAMELWGAIDQAVAVFVGMHDSATPRDLDALLNNLKARSLRDVERLDPEALERAVRKSTFGGQRILSDWMGKLPDAPALPNNRAFALFGQRYTLDGHTLHAVVEDRVPGRQLPTAFDVGFSALRNNAALRLLEPALREPSALPGALGSMRAFADGQKEEYWASSFYTLWLAALRGMAPVEAGGLPKSTRTEGWARRTLLTQLGSWSELRHDTILYAKQSYSTFIICEFPDAYVDPYPEVFQRLVQSSDLGVSVVTRLQRVTGKKLDGVRAYFEGAKQTFSKLQLMAERELQGKRLTDEQLAFVNKMIVAHHTSGEGCGGGGVFYSGWYKQLFYTADIADPDFSIADVHTSKDGILHVGKRYPLQAVVSIDDGAGPRVFTGAVYSFHQVISGQRLSDSEWARQTPRDEAWLAPILAHARHTAEPE
jgi:hypothetical protein